MPGPIIPWWTLAGAGAASGGLWAAGIYGAYKAWEQPVIREGLKIAFRLAF